MKKNLLLVLLLLLAPTVAAAAAAAAAADTAEPKPGLTVEAIRIEPAAPGPDTLCKLSVTLRSTGTKTASALGFKVTVDGKELAVYRNELVYKPVEPGATAEIRLHNFWSSETGRPFPAGGKMNVEVTLTEARWMDVKTENGAEVWTPIGPVEGLPKSKTIAVIVKKSTQ